MFIFYFFNLFSKFRKNERKQKNLEEKKIIKIKIIFSQGVNPRSIRNQKKKFKFKQKTLGSFHTLKKRIRNTRFVISRHTVFLLKTGKRFLPIFRGEASQCQFIGGKSKIIGGNKFS